MTDRHLTVVEMERRRCVNIYGTSPCAAEIGVTGAIKCFNTTATCQDPANFSAEGDTSVYRFASNAAYLPRELDANPVIESVEVSPAVVSLGRGLGRRETLRVTMSDRPHSDAGLDPYLSERGYDAFRQGTFWGKFRARDPYIRGRNVTLIEGNVGQLLADMERRHYIADSFDIAADGGFVLECKDWLKSLDDDRALAPSPSNGFLSDTVSSGASSFSLLPSGIGNAEYPASNFYVAIGGRELVFVGARSGDVCSSLTRGQFNTVAAGHAAQDRVQLCLQYAAEKPGEIIYDLATEYAGIDPSVLPLDAWNIETDTFLNRVYSALIAEPTGVKTLIEEMIVQAALMVWSDPVAQLVRLRVLRPVDDSARRFDKEVWNNLGVTEQPELRVSQVLTYFAQINPLRKLDDTDNFRSSHLTIATGAEDDYGSAAIYRIFSRWIGEGGRAVVQTLNAKHLSRYLHPPRRLTFDLPRRADSIGLGDGATVAAPIFQDTTGAAVDVPVNVTALKPSKGMLGVEAEEMRFATIEGAETTQHVIVFDSNTFDRNIRERHDALYGAPQEGDVVVCVVQDATTIGSANPQEISLDTGEWPEGVDIIVTIVGHVRGRGGRGGHGVVAPGGSSTPGLPGGTALKVRAAINLAVSGTLWGGGGGGGGGGDFSGGGGAGVNPGSPGAVFPGTPSGAAGTPTAGGVGVGSGGVFFSGAGGNPGQDGLVGLHQGGAAGLAIDGVGNVTFGTASVIDGDWEFTEGAVIGSIIGPQIN